MKSFNSIEICAGAGGQALGLEQAGFDHLALVELENIACQTLRTNRPHWNVIEGDVRYFKAESYKDRVDLFAGGVPCPPFSVAGKQLGPMDERDLFPEAIRIISECRPKAVLLENVRGLLDPKFESYRAEILKELTQLGYMGEWRLIHASDFGVSQSRPRAILIALRSVYWPYFTWPEKSAQKPPNVGDLLFPEMAELGWERVHDWRTKAVGIAPTLVGGSKKHGGPDLGPTRARKAWLELGVDGSGIADKAPVNGFAGNPKLTVRMAAIVQGFPRDWQFAGKKTPAYRQIGNAFPPPVAKALGKSIIKALNNGKEG
jgi:DNA (cytosine-5)-methyltransferase 1